MSKDDTQPADDDLELLLPWRATGRLDPATTRRLDAALAADPDLRRKYALVEEELNETFAAHSELGAPSGQARDRLFAQIAAEEKAAAGHGVWTRVVDFFGSLTPRAVALSAAAAALVIVAQTGLLTTTLAPRATFHTASTPGVADGGSYALVAFAPEATAAQISELLAARGAVIVDGPRAGGLYRVRVATTRLDPAEMKNVLADLTARRDTIRLAVQSD